MPARGEVKNPLDIKGVLTSAHWSVGQLNTVALEVLILVCLVYLSALILK